ncbi:MAG: aldo/keto reductase, partial [Armatimonadetes bacterium]|nr:aldo/keto reductase [Armatimonadota bacterium]
MSQEWSRRELLQAGLSAATTGGLSEAALAQNGAAPLPTRVLGRTREQVPILGFGTAPVGVKRTLKDAVALFHRAIDLGVTYLDTAPELAGYGKAQEQLGHVVPDRRKEVFLVTKLWEPGMGDALKLLEKNLKELRVERVDLLYAHSIGSDKMDPDLVFGRAGTMAALRKAQQEGLTRFIGVSGHNRPARFLRALQEAEFDVMMNAVNLGDRYTYGFEEKVWPAAAKKNVGLVAMKVFGGMGGNQPLSTRTMPVEHVPLAFRYALSLPNV